MIRWQNLSASSQNCIIKLWCFVIARMPGKVHPDWYFNNWIIKNNCAKSFNKHVVSGCKESQFYGLPFWQVVASMYYPKSLLTSPKNFWMSSIDYSSSVIWISQKTSLTLKLRTEFTSPITKFTSPGLSDMTLFAHCVLASCSFKEYSFRVLQF